MSFLPTLINLIIYYSGHGMLTKKFGNKDFFHWVPYDYNRGLSYNADTTKLCSVNFNLMNILGSIKFYHLILITDSCYSGGSLSFSNYFDQSNKLAGYDPKEEGSVCAACSSASNKVYYGGQKYSLFTSHLIDMLERNNANKLLAEELFLELSKCEALKS